MFEELIEEIKKSPVLNDSGWFGGSTELRDYVNKHIISLIEDCEPPELDAPDSEGWWWFRVDGIGSARGSGFYEFMMPNKVYVDEFTWLSLKDFKGKWTNAGFLYIGSVGRWAFQPISQ